MLMHEKVIRSRKEWKINTKKVIIKIKNICYTTLSRWLWIFITLKIKNTQIKRIHTLICDIRRFLPLREIIFPTKDFFPYFTMMFSPTFFLLITLVSSNTVTELCDSHLTRTNIFISGCTMPTWFDTIFEVTWNENSSVWNKISLNLFNLFCF